MAPVLDVTPRDTPDMMAGHSAQSKTTADVPVQTAANVTKRYENMQHISDETTD